MSSITLIKEMQIKTVLRFHFLTYQDGKDPIYCVGEAVGGQAF